MIKKSLRRFKSLFTRVHDLHYRNGNLAYQNLAWRLQDKILHSDESGITYNKYCDYEIIVSLTSYGKRLWQVANTIASLMEQTCKANRIILWVSNDEISDLPEALVKLQDRGLEVRGTRDIRSYKKLVPSLLEYPDAAIITVDDDILYPCTLLERLIKGHIGRPLSIIACRNEIICLNGICKLKPYRTWPLRAPNTKREEKLIFFNSGGGVLYPPHSLHDEVINESAFMDLAPLADDVWFNAMARLKNTEIYRLPMFSSTGEDYMVNYDVQDNGLFVKNVNGGENDKQLKAVFDKYDIYRFLQD